MAVVNAMNHIQLLDKDPFKLAAYANTIVDNIGLKTQYYLQAITLYQDGCVSDWHLKYVNGLIKLRQYKTAYKHIAVHHKNVRGLDNSLLIKAANYQFTHKQYFIACKLYEKVNNNMIWRKRLNNKIAICYRETAQYTASIRYFKRHLQQQAEDNNSIKTYIQLANVYSIKGKYKKALTIYNHKLTKAHIEEHRLYYEVARCYYHKNDFEMCLFYLNQELNRFERGKNRDVALYYKGIIFSRKYEMYPEALECFKSVDEISLSSITACIFNELGYVYFRLDEFDLSLKCYQECIKNNKADCWFAYKNMAMIHCKRGNHREALQLCEKLDKMIHKSKKLSKSGKKDLKINKLNLPSFFGRCCYTLGQYRAALKHFLVALKGNKHESIHVLKQIAHIYHYKLHKYKKACKLYVKLEKLGEINKSDMEFYCADCLQKLGKYQDAFEMMKRYLEKYPDSVRCLNKMVTLNMIGTLKHDDYCDVLIQRALNIDVNVLYTNYIYAFHLNIIRKASPSRYLESTQSLMDDRHEHERMDMGMFVDIAMLFTFVDTECAQVTTLKFFEAIGLNHFQRMLSRFPDNSVVHILYAHFLAKLKKLELLEAFHTKVINEYKLSGNMKYICTIIREYAVTLRDIGRVDFAIEMTKTIRNKNCFLYYLGLGVFYALKNDYNESLCFFQKSLDINAMNFSANAYYGNVLFKMGKIAESVTYFKVAFSANAKHKKYVDLEFLMNYAKGMCIVEGYDHCITELSRIVTDSINCRYGIAIHRLIVQIYVKCNYNHDCTPILQHLKAIFEWKAKQQTSTETTCCGLI